MGVPSKMTQPERIADAAAGVSIITVLGLTLAQWNNIIHIVAGVVAILAGVAAIAYHIVKIRSLRKKGE